MKIDFSQEIKTIKGESFSPVLTLADAATNALLADTQEGKVDGAAKAKRFQIALKVVNGGEVDLSVDEVKTIKDQIGIIYNPPVVGRAWPMLDKTEKEKLQ